jgi:hypothetical protein
MFENRVLGEYLRTWYLRVFESRVAAEYFSLGGRKLQINGAVSCWRRLGSDF